jgi:hypothetical protein
MAKYVFVVLTNPVAGREDEFNAWYDNQHLPDVLKVEGFVAAQRFKLTPEGDKPDAPHRYLALYEIETDDLARTQAALSAVAGSPAMPLSDAMDSSRLSAVMFQAIGEKMHAGATAKAA